MTKKIEKFVKDHNKAQIEKWAEHISQRINETSQFTRPDHYEVLTVDHGRKYSRIWSTRGNKSAYAFVEIATGDIYRCATWRAPAKHVRGNIQDQDGSWNIGVYEWGAKYIK